MAFADALAGVSRASLLAAQSSTGLPSAPALFGVEINLTVIYDPGVVQNPFLVPDFTKGVYRFRVNPVKIDLAEEKIVQTVLTRGGWDKQFWGLKTDVSGRAVGNKLIPITLTGTTGSLVPAAALQVLGINDPRLSFAWKKFEELQDFFRSRNNDLVMIHDGVQYEGNVVKFSWGQVAERPWILNYTLEFLAYPERIRRLWYRFVPFSSVPGVISSAQTPVELALSTGTGAPAAGVERGLGSGAARVGGLAG